MGRLIDDPAVLRDLAERIDTGEGDPEIVRALVVFNVGEADASGVAVYSASMRWPVDRPFPPVIVRTSSGIVPSAVLGMTETDEPGTADRKRLRFDLAFAVRDVPACGWRVYWGEYVGVHQSAGGVAGPVSSDLRVLETLCHRGDLPAVGFGDIARPGSVE